MLNSVGHFSGTVFSRLLVTLLGGSDIFILLQEVISEMEDPEQMGYIHLDRQVNIAQPQTPKSLKNPFP